MGTESTVTVVIPAYNAARTIEACVEACLAQDYPELEIIVVDDGSTDNTKTLLQSYPVKYIYQENSGPATARNTGWKAARGKIVCFTDSDCVPSRDWVSRLVDEYISEDVAGVGGTYEIANDNNLLAACIHEEIVQRHLRMPRYVNYLGSFNASYRRVVLEEVGGFDESHRIASGEDNDLAYRVIKHGYQLVFTREARVAHYHPHNVWRYLKQQFWHGYWRMKIYRDHPSMAKGDAYGGLTDFVQPPLALATLCLLPFSFLIPIAYLVLALLLAEVALQLPMPLTIIKRTGQMRYFALAPVTFLRGYTRGLGMAWGILRFFVLWRVPIRGVVRSARRVLRDMKEHLPYLGLVLVVYVSLVLADAYIHDWYDPPFPPINDLNVHIPRAFKLNNPRLFARDPAFESFGWKSFGRLDMLLFPLLLSRLFPILGGMRPTLITLSFILGLVFTVGNYSLTYYLSGDPLAGVIAAFLASLTYWALGAVQLGFTPAQVLPRNFIVAVSPMVMVLFLRWRAKRTLGVLYALLGLMANFHPLAALHLVLILTLTLITTSGLSWSSLEKVVRGGLTSLACALPSVLTFLPTLADVVTVAPERTSTLVTRYDFTIAPSRGELLSFGMAFLPLALFGGLGFYQGLKGQESHQSAFGVYSILYLIVLLLPWVGVMINVFTLSLQKLEMLRITRYYFLLNFAPLGILLAGWLQERRRIQSLLSSGVLRILIVFSILMILPRPEVDLVIIQRGVEWFGSNHEASSAMDSGVKSPKMTWDWEAFSDLCRWADMHTPVDALFLAPVDWSLFRVYSRRGLVASWTGALRQGWERYDTVRALYDQPDAERFIDAAETYAADYIVVMPGLTLPELAIVYENDHYVVYKAR